MKVQSCSTLFSSWTPISGSEVTSWPLWRQCIVVILSTRAAVQWNGSRSPLKTTWRWDGSSDRVCSSRGPSEQFGKKRCRLEPKPSFWIISAALVVQPWLNVSTDVIVSMLLWSRMDSGNSNTYIWSYNIRHSSRAAGIAVFQTFGLEILQNMGTIVSIAKSLSSTTNQCSMEQSHEPPFAVSHSHHSSAGFPWVHIVVFPSGS